MLTPPQLSSKQQELQSGIRAFELKVMQASSDWDKERRALRAGVQLATQKRLWVDYVCKPKVMQANVEAAQKKVAKL